MVWQYVVLDRLHDTGKFSESPANKEVEKRWCIQADSLRAFVNECVERAVKDKDVGYNETSRPSYIEKDLFYWKYQLWCEYNNTVAIKKETVGKRLPTIISAKTERLS